MNDQLCVSCKFWMLTQQPGQQGTMGQCRWGPPQIAVVMAPAPQMTPKEQKIIELSGGRAAAQQGPQPIFLTMWPSTKPDQGCGKWEGEPLKAKEAG